MASQETTYNHNSVWFLAKYQESSMPVIEAAALDADRPLHRGYCC